MKPKHLLQTSLVILAMVLCAGVYYTRTSNNEISGKKINCPDIKTSSGSTNDFIFLESFSHLITFVEPK